MKQSMTEIDIKTNRIAIKFRLKHFQSKVRNIYVLLFILLARGLPLYAQSDLIDKLSKDLIYADDSAKFALYMTICETYYPDNYPLAHQYADSALLFAKKIEYWKGMGLAEERKGLLHRFTANYETAENHFNNALDIFYEHQLYSQVARTKKNLAVVMQEKGDFVQAMKLYTESSKLAEEIGDKKTLAYGLRGISFIYHNYHEPERSLENAKRAYQTLLETEYDPLDLADMLQTLGIALKESNKQDSAIACYELAAEYNKEFNEIGSLAGNLNNIAIIYENQGQYRKALNYYSQSLHIDHQRGDSLGLTYSHIGLANVYFELNNFDSALYHAQQSFHIAESINALQRIQKAGESLTNIYRSVEKYDSALHYYDIITRVKDSLFQQAKFREAQELQTQYETEKKEQAIASLQQEKEAVEFRRNTYAILSVLILIVGLLVYNRQRLKSRKNRELLEKEQEVDRMKSRFFANISHEFRTPLTLIMGPIETLISNNNDLTVKKQLGIMRKNASRLLDLINQLLDLSKLESGKLELKVIERNIIPVIKGITMSFHSLAESKNIDLKIESENDNLILYFDQDKIEKILTNLLSNAFKFTPDHGQIIVKVKTISSSGQPEKTGALAITVMDNGKGISKNNINYIFDRFYQTDNSLIKENEGTGIGLALTKELVELHHGTISASSEEGEGTAITFQLSLGKDHFENEEIFSALEAGKTKIITETEMPSITSELEREVEELSETDNQKPIILLVEDNEDVRSYIKETLNTAYRILEAGDGKEGIARAIEHIPDLIISDVMMPIMDGNEVCKNLKQDEKTSHIPIILLTAKASMESRIEGLETEADDYLTKPFVPKELLARVHNLIVSRKKLRERYNREVILKPADIAINSVDEVFLERLMKVVEDNLENEHFSVEKLGKDVGMSRSQIHRKLQALTNQSASQFIRSFRLQRAMELIKKNAGTISEIGYQVGFGSPSYFNKCFLQLYGYTPGEIRNQDI